MFVCLGLAVGGCATEQNLPQPEASHTVTVPPAAGVYKVGKPYQIDNVWYYPHEQPDYDETGIASWYGPTFYGKHTADGEIYDGDALTAAHRTLPMPVNVRVTNLENGKSIVVRVNDRGPYARGRIIDLSRRAAELAGRDPDRHGAGARDLSGPRRSEQWPAAAARNAAGNRLRPAGRTHRQGGQSVAGDGPRRRRGTAGQRKRPCRCRSMCPRPPVVARPSPTGQVTQVPVPAATHLYVQVGAFSKRDNARTLLARLGGDLRISTLQRNGQTLYRVRTGPLNSVEDADAALARITGAGSNDAQIVVDQ